MAIPSISGCRGVEAASASSGRLAGHGCPATIWAITAPAFKGLPSSDGIVVFGNSP
jgi:hypothetical protein